MPVVRISDLSWGGEGIGRIEGKCVVVPHSLPGEVVEVELVHFWKSYDRGRLIRILDPSPDRVEPPCSFYRECGGCQLQHLAPHRQVQEKERLFRQALNHALKPKKVQVYPTLISPAAFGYRHRLHLKTAWKNNRFNLGLFKTKSHDVIAINRCLLANDQLNEVLRVLLENPQSQKYGYWTSEIELQVFEMPRRGGIVFTAPKRIDPSQKKRITKELFPILKLNYLLFQESNQLPLTGEHHFSPEKDSPEFFFSTSDTGLPRDIRMACFPQVFTQINLDLNQQLMARLLSGGIIDRRATVLDLYCGLGNFFLPIALTAQEVIGLEAFSPAVVNARWNQKINRISNCTFIQTKVGEGIHQLKLPNKTISLVILDPPRTGALEVIPMLDARNIRGILYISCNPMTLFRDLTHLVRRDWSVEG